MTLRIPISQSATRPLATLLLLVMLLLSPGCRFEGKSEFDQLKDKYQAFSDLVAAAGGTAKREYHSKGGISLEGWLIDLNHVQITGELIDKTVEYAQQDPVFDLNLSDSSITDEQLAKLDAGEVLQKCFFLDLRNTAITDAGLDKLTNIYVIHELKVKGTKITPEAIKRLGDRQMAQVYTPQSMRVRPEVDIATK